MPDVMKHRDPSKKWRRLLLIFSWLLVSLLLVVIIVLVAILLQPTTQKPEPLCHDAHCIKTAARLLGAMKTEVDPCENFYEFACGQWVKEHRVPEDKGSIDTMEEVSTRLERDLQDLLESKREDDIGPVQKAKTFYRSCMDTDTTISQGTEGMRRFITGLGGWPVLDPAWDPRVFDLETMLATARQYTTNFVWPIPHGIMVGLNILNDFKVYGKHTIYFDQPSLFMEGKEMYENTDLIQAYIRYTSNAAIALGADPKISIQQMTDMVTFETQLARMTVAVADRRDMEGNYKNMSVAYLKTLYPQFDWLRFLEGTFRDADIDVDSNEPVVLWMQQYYDKLFDLIQSTPNQTIANYIVWRLITEQFVALGDKFSEMRLEFRKVTEGVKQLKEHALRCSQTTNEYLDFATGRMYSENMFGPKERKHMLELISYLRKVFKTLVQDLDWMDTETKEQALKKLEKMKSLIGFPSSIFNDTFITMYYENINISEDNFFENLRSIRRYKGLKQLSELRQPTYESWPERPAIVNAFYHSGLNAIVFPAGILQSPYYDINSPASINFGGIGLVIGHEITHGYDASGRAFDGNGLLHNWWSNFSLKHYNEKATCVINHYSEFEVPIIKMNINGNTTLSENLADIGGIKQSHLAYRLWLADHAGKDIRLPGLAQYTNEQLFFINTAQLWCSKFTDEAARRSVFTSVHSLPMFRVLGELRNSHGFSEAFKCPVGSYMNPSREKCSLW